MFYIVNGISFADPLIDNARELFYGNLDDVAHGAKYVMMYKSER